MKTLLVNVSYVDNTDKFWCESTIKNKIIEFDSKKDNIHDVIKELCYEQDYVELSYKGKPQSNIYQDLKNDEVKRIGYVYRGKSEIHERDMIKSQRVLYDVWVTINIISDFEFEEIN